MAKTASKKATRSLAAFGSKHKAKLAAGGVILFVYALMLALGMGCPIRFFTGISCAGCGMTRACLSALRLDVTAAFAYHPLWIALPFAAFFLIFFKVKKMERSFWTTLYVSVAAMLAVYGYRLLLTDSEIVVWAPESGLLPRLARVFSDLFQGEEAPTLSELLSQLRKEFYHAP